MTAQLSGPIPLAIQEITRGILGGPIPLAIQEITRGILGEPIPLAIQGIIKVIAVGLTLLEIFAADSGG